MHLLIISRKSVSMKSGHVQFVLGHYFDPSFHSTLMKFGMSLASECRAIAFKNKTKFTESIFLFNNFLTLCHGSFFLCMHSLTQIQNRNMPIMVQKDKQQFADVEVGAYSWSVCFHLQQRNN